jgi:three-Cys-motif partner protein
LAKDKSAFFTTKDGHPWSKTKDSLLGCYLKPFFDKTYGHSQDGYVYVDAFAGPGEYSSGEFGSPILAIQRLQATARGRRNKCCAQFIFGEANGRDRARLKAASDKACGSVNYLRTPLICESFEDALTVAQQSKPVPSKRPATIFYYVDPYGVKDLRLDLLCQSPNFAHTEALVNFNTVGFMRDGADALRIALERPAGVSVVDCGFDDVSVGLI